MPRYLYYYVIFNCVMRTIDGGGDHSCRQVSEGEINEDNYECIN